MDGGTVGILNVGAGDTKLTFDKSNPAERIRAARIVRDMIRRGYALLIEVEQPDGTKAHQRALDFDEAHCEYIIADFDPTPAAEAPKRDREYVKPPQYGTQEEAHEEAGEAPAGSAAASRPETPAPRRRGGRTKRVPAESTRAVAVARSAGG